MSPSLSSARRVALVTCDAYPHLYEDDLPLGSALGSLGVEAVPAVWSDRTVDWTGFSVLVMRTPWDYFERLGEFREWLDARIAGPVPMCNDGELLRWNLDKRYLADLRDAGVELVPTAFVEPGSAVNVEAIARERGWSEIVVKPSISGGAYRTYRFATREAPLHAAAMAEILTDRGILVQPFLPEILREGELSFVFLDGEFSHAVRKRAHAGDYRVQFQYGGTTEDAKVSPGLIDQARAVVRAAPKPPVYARVDGLEIDGRFVLMELEVLEPLLFLGRAPGAAKRLARAIVRGLPAKLAEYPALDA